MANLPKSVTILDETMREGLQIETRTYRVREAAAARRARRNGREGSHPPSAARRGAEDGEHDELAERFVPKPASRQRAKTTQRSRAGEEYHPSCSYRTRSQTRATERNVQHAQRQQTGEEERARGPTRPPCEEKRP